MLHNEALRVVLVIQSGGKFGDAQKDKVNMSRGGRNIVVTRFQGTVRPKGSEDTGGGCDATQTMLITSPLWIFRSFSAQGLGRKEL